MAENKKSFLMYCDLIHTVEKMPNEKAGELLKFILDYVNDKDPETDDLLIQIAFEPIKQQLKRDLIHWEEKKEKSKDNGALGNLKRWNKDLYDKVINKELELKEAVKIAHDRKESPPDENESPPIANIAVNDTVNVTVNDTVINKVITPDESAERYKKFIAWLNKQLNKKYRGDKKSKAAFKARLKDGYSGDDFAKALAAMMVDDHHKESGYKWITPEFITRVDKLEKFINAESKPAFVPIDWNKFLQ